MVTAATVERIKSKGIHIVNESVRQLASLLKAVALHHGNRLQQRSISVARFLQSRIEVVALAWLVIISLGCLPRLLFPATPITGWQDLFWLLFPYACIAAAPVAGYLVATGSFPRGLLTAQPALRLSIYGRWRELGVVEARDNPAFGPAGFLTSLLIGLLLNVVVRSFEFLVSMPAMGGNAPAWGQLLFTLMAGDVIIMSFFYAVCFVMALRAVPLFPRMLLLAWAIDIMIQLVIARTITETPGVPQAVMGALHTLLEGNITKVLISAVVWLPYLILSDRVNLTYRCRVRQA